MNAEQSEGLAIWRGYVTGLTHHEYFRVADLIKQQTRLNLRKVDNEYDSNAIGVFLGSAQIGWIPKNNKGVLANKDEGHLKQVSAIVCIHDMDVNVANRLLIQVFKNQSIKSMNHKVSIQGLDDFDLMGRPQVANLSAKATKEIQNPQLQYYSAISNGTIKEKDMTMVDKMIVRNKNYAVSAAYLEAGRLANKELSKAIASQMPMMVRGYADTPIGRLVLANIAMMAIEQFKPDEERLRSLSNAMCTHAYQELIQELDIEGFIENLLENKKIRQALEKVAPTAGKSSGPKRGDEPEKSAD